jgi:hypothetical protein
MKCGRRMLSFKLVEPSIEFSINKELGHDSDPQQQWYNKQRRFAPGI